ncbi:DivIVA domain-containing protein [Sphaerisporangium sp. NPDC004334]
MNRFPRVLGVRTGYDPDQVDALIQRIEATLGRGVLDGPPITAEEIRSARFNAKLGGYNETAVDYALDAFVIAVEIRGDTAATGAPGSAPSPSAAAPVAASPAAAAESAWPKPVAAAESAWPRPAAPSEFARPKQAAPSDPAWPKPPGPPESTRPRPAFEPFRPAPASGTPRPASLFEPADPLSAPAFSAPQAAPVPEPSVAAPMPGPSVTAPPSGARDGQATAEGATSRVGVKGAKGSSGSEEDDDAPTLPGMPKVTARGPAAPEAGEASSERSGTGQPAAAWLEEQAARVERVLFRPARLGAGYNEDEVDVFLDHVVATLRGTGDHPLTAEQVRKATFSTVVFKTGYAVTQVDAFLAEIAGVLDRREALVGEQGQPV